MDPGGSTLPQSFMLPFHCLQTSDTGTDITAHTVRIFFFHINARILHCFRCSRHCILTEQLHTSCCLEIHKFFRIKIFDLCRQACLEPCGVKFGDLIKSGSFFFDTVPEILNTDANWCHGSHTGHYNSSHILPPVFTLHRHAAIHTEHLPREIGALLLGKEGPRPGHGGPLDHLL